MSSAHWIVPPPPSALMGMRAAPGVPAPGHVGQEPARCPGCVAGAPLPPPPKPARPPHVQRVVPQRAPVYAPRPIARVLDVVAPELVDVLDGVKAPQSAPPAAAPMPVVPQPPAGPEAPQLAPARALSALSRAVDEASLAMLLAPRPGPCAAAPMRSLIVLALASIALERDDRAARDVPVTIADLTVRAWEMWPARFAMTGHAEHPCSNRVLAKLAGPDGCVEQGHVRRVAQGTVALTAKGLKHCREVFARHGRKA